MPRGQDMHLDRNMHVRPDCRQEVSKLGTSVPRRSAAASAPGPAAGPSTLDLRWCWPHLPWLCVYADPLPPPPQ